MAMFETLVGAGIGGGTGLMADMEARKARKREEREAKKQAMRNRIATFRDALAGYEQARSTGQSTLAQMAFDMARDARM